MRIDVDIGKALRAGERRFDLAVKFTSEADVTVLFGPSGAGKTQTLLAIAGLSRPDRGVIRIDERTLFDETRRIDVAARRRRIGFVFQDYALFPHLSVLHNVAFARAGAWPWPRLSRIAHAPADVREIIDAFALGAFLKNHPQQLSGGQRQRVALARALAARPGLLLLDEPFAALDAPLRARLRDELLAVRARFGVPMVVITHDPEDVGALGGRMIRFDEGVVVGDGRADAPAEPTTEAP
ncbi:MAG: ATP-binding cassette domain-containing protein [Rudaea sp.]